MNSKRILLVVLILTTILISVASAGITRLVVEKGEVNAQSHISALITKSIVTRTEDGPGTSAILDATKKLSAKLKSEEKGAIRSEHQPLCDVCDSYQNQNSRQT
jgi:flagellar basal body-associated protein FliL